MKQLKPFKVEKLPIQYNLDKELIVLISEANLKYGEYKSNLKNSQFDSRFFLDSKSKEHKYLRMTCII